MVDGDESRVRKCRKTALPERDDGVIVLPYVRNVMVGTKYCSWGNKVDIGSCSGNKKIDV